MGRILADERMEGALVPRIGYQGTSRCKMQSDVTLEWAENCTPESIFDNFLNLLKHNREPHHPEGIFHTYAYQDSLINDVNFHTHLASRLTLTLTNILGLERGESVKVFRRHTSNPHKPQCRHPSALEMFWLSRLSPFALGIGFGASRLNSRVQNS